MIRFRLEETSLPLLWLKNFYHQLPYRKAVYSCSERIFLTSYAIISPLQKGNWGAYPFEDKNEEKMIHLRKERKTGKAFLSRNTSNKGQLSYSSVEKFIKQADVLTKTTVKIKSER